MRTYLIRFLTVAVPRDLLRRIYHRYSSVVSWLRYRDATFPRIISIEINTHCNRACEYCPNVAVPQKRQLMDAKVFMAVVERLRDIRYAGVVDFIFFSEPTIHPALAGCIALVKNRVPWCSTRICTNGDRLTEEYVTQLRDAGLDRIYAMRHRPVSKVWENGLRSKMRELAGKFPGLFVLMDIDEVERTSGLHNFEGLVKVDKIRGRQMRDGHPFCDVHTHVAQITVNGDWILCCVDYAKTLSFGNLMNKGFLEIWRSPFFVRLRMELRSGHARLPKCQECPCMKDYNAPDLMVPTIITREAVSEVMVA